MPSTALLPLLALLAVTPPAGEEAMRSKFQSQYDALARAIEAEGVALLVAHSFRLVGGEAINIEQTWKDNFAAIHRYGPVEFTVLDAVEQNGEVIVDVQRTIFLTVAEGAPEQFESGHSRDHWRNENDQWRLVRREDLPGKLTGSVLTPPKPVSLRLQRLEHAIQANDPQALEAFWREVQGHTPLVESIDDAPDHRLVTFLWRDDAQTERIEVRGGPYEGSRTPFARIPNTDVWYHTERLPLDARYVYSLVVHRRIERKRADSKSESVLVETYPLDPLNPLVFNEGSVLELQDAPNASWHVAREDVPRGQLEPRKLQSAALGERRAIAVYFPPGYQPGEVRAVAVFLDGVDCRHLMSVPATLDNLLAAKRIRPTVALFVDSQGTRGRDLVFSDPFVTFLADELIPWAEHELNMQAEPATSLIAGMSLGGLTASYTAQQRPDVFGNVLSQSGSFWRRRPERPSIAEGWLPGEIAARDRAGVRYFMEVGLFEAPGMVENNRRMRDVLRAKGYDVTYSEYSGGHDHVNWRVSLGDGLAHLLQP